MIGKIKSINISKTKGTKKTPAPSATLVKDFGIKDDAHAGAGDRQVSILSWERIVNFSSDLLPGEFAENITTEGVELSKLQIGDEIRIGTTLLKISKIGKECHSGCEIRKRMGDCIMPREGIFAEVQTGGEISAGDEIEVRHED